MYIGMGKSINPDVKKNLEIIGSELLNNLQKIFDPSNGLFYLTFFNTGFLKEITNFVSCKS